MSVTFAPMWRVSWRSVLAHRGRMLLTFISVVLGTAFISGSLLLTTALEKSCDAIIDAGVEGIDVGLVGSQTSPQGVPFTVLEEISSWPEVRAVNVIGDGPGTPTGTRAAGDSGIIVILPDGTPLQAGSSGAHPAAAHPPENTVGPVPDITDGAAPATPEEVLINSSAAERAGLNVGDAIQVITPAEQVTVTVSGIYDSPRDIAGWVGVMFTPERYLEMFTLNDYASQAVIAAAEDADPMTVRNRIGQTWPWLTPLLPEQIAERMSGSVVQQMEFVRYVLVIFGAIALLVGAFNIANTFAMVVGQRTREFALLRSIGVSTAQVAVSVIAEAALVGLVGSVVGIAVAFGVIITMAAAVAPARRAGMLPPVQAFDLSDARSSRAPRLTLLAAGGLGGVGAVLLLAAALITTLNGVTPSVETRLSLIAVGVVAMFTALALAGPTLVTAAGLTLGAALTLPLGAVGTLARRNSVRNPRRSAASALALALGVGLVACVGTIGSTTKASVFGMAESSVTSPFVLDSLAGSSLQGQPGSTSGLSLPPETRQRAEWTTGVEDAGTLMNVPLRANNWDHQTTTVLDADFTQFMSLGILQGTVGDASEPAVMISAEYADQTGLQVGDLIPLTAYEGDEADAVWIPVSAVYTDTSLLGHLAVSLPAAAAVVDNLESVITRVSVFVSADGSVSDEQLRHNLTNVMDPLLVVQVKSKAEYGSALGTQINQLLLIVYALLALAVIIASLGIINTLMLSVAERTRELGVLRAVGLQRREIQWMVQIESLIISIHGAVVGIALGTSAGWAATRVLGSKGMASPEIPWPQIGLMVGASIILGVVAALIPAIKASYTPALEAIER